METSQNNTPSNNINNGEEFEGEEEIEYNMSENQNEDEIEYNNINGLNTYNNQLYTNSFPNYYKEPNQFEYYTFQGEKNQGNILTYSDNKDEDEQQQEIFQNNEDYNNNLNEEIVNTNDNEHINSEVEKNEDVEAKETLENNNNNQKNNNYSIKSLNLENKNDYKIQGINMQINNKYQENNQSEVSINGKKIENIFNIEKIKEKNNMEKLKENIINKMNNQKFSNYKKNKNKYTNENIKDKHFYNNLEEIIQKKEKEAKKKSVENILKDSLNVSNDEMGSNYLLNRNTNNTDDITNNYLNNNNYNNEYNKTVSTEKISNENYNISNLETYNNSSINNNLENDTYDKIGKRAITKLKYEYYRNMDSPNEYEINKTKNDNLINKETFEKRKKQDVLIQEIMNRYKKPITYKFDEHSEKKDLSKYTNKYEKISNNQITLSSDSVQIKNLINSNKENKNNKNNDKDKSNNKLVSQSYKYINNNKKKRIKNISSENITYNNPFIILEKESKKGNYNTQTNVPNTNISINNIYNQDLNPKNNKNNLKYNHIHKNNHLSIDYYLDRKKNIYNKYDIYSNGKDIENLTGDIKPISFKEINLMENDEEKINKLYFYGQENYQCLKRLQLKYNILKDEFNQLLKIKKPDNNTTFNDTNNTYENNNKYQNDEFKDYLLKENDKLKNENKNYEEIIIPLVNYINEINSLFNNSKIDILKIKQIVKNYNSNNDISSHKFRKNNTYNNIMQQNTNNDIKNPITNITSFLNTCKDEITNQLNTNEFLLNNRQNNNYNINNINNLNKNIQIENNNLSNGYQKNNNYYNINSNTNNNDNLNNMTSDHNNYHEINSEEALINNKIKKNKNHFSYNNSKSISIPNNNINNTVNYNYLNNKQNYSNNTQPNISNLKYKKIKNQIPNKKILKKKLKINKSIKKGGSLNTLPFQYNEKRNENLTINRSNLTEYTNQFDNANENNYKFNYYQNRNLSCKACNSGISNSSRGFSPLICSPILLNK